MNGRWRLFTVSAACGLLWGAIVTFVLLEPRQRMLFGSGILFSPIIGMVAGFIAERFHGADRIAMAVISLVSLYLTAALYGLGGDIVLALVSRTDPGAALWTTLPWAMTIRGFVLWMWPLSYLNHRFVGRFG